MLKKNTPYHKMLLRVSNNEYLISSEFTTWLMMNYWVDFGNEFSDKCFPRWMEENGINREIKLPCEIWRVLFGKFLIHFSIFNSAEISIKRKGRQDGDPERLNLDFVSFPSIIEPNYDINLAKRILENEF